MTLQCAGVRGLLVIVVLGLVPSVVFAQLVNPHFEAPRMSPGVADFNLVSAGSVPGWETTAGDNMIEIWSDGFNGFASYNFDQHVELNANFVSTLYQDLVGVPANRTVGFQFAHRGRDGVDTIRLMITDLGPDGVLGGGDDTVLFNRDYATDNTQWALYTSVGEPAIVTLGNTMRMAFVSVSAAGGNQAVGNFLDAVDFGLGIAPAPVAAGPVMGPSAPPVTVPVMGALWLLLMALLFPAVGALGWRHRKQ